MDVTLYLGYIIAGIASLSCLVAGLELYFRINKTESEHKIDEIHKKLNLVMNI